MKIPGGKPSGGKNPSSLTENGNITSEAIRGAGDLPGECYDAEPTNINNLPGDIMGSILSRCHSITDVRNLCRTSRNINTTYVEHRFHILRLLISRQYNPCDELYELVAVLKHGIVSTPRAIYIDTPLHVGFQHEPSSKHIILSAARRVSPRRAMQVILSQWDLGLLVHVCTTIDQWVAMFPQVRFRKGPAHIRRCLRPIEERRLSRALVRWWRYSLQFHGKLGWHLSVPWDSFPDDGNSISDSGQDSSSGESEYEIDQASQYDDPNDYTVAPGSPQDEALDVGDAHSTYYSRVASLGSEEGLEELLSRNNGSLYSEHSEHALTFEAEGPDLSTGRAFMRMLPTMHLVELHDLFSCVHDMVTIDLCPSYESLIDIMEESFHPKYASLSWGWQRQNLTVVNTYLKLPPDDLLALWTTKISSPHQSYNQTRVRVRERALGMLPGLGLTRQSLSTSLDYVLSERSVIDVWDNFVANNVAYRFGLELKGWTCWGPPMARLRSAGILELADREGNEGRQDNDEEEEYGRQEKRYSRDEIRSGRKPDCGPFIQEDASWEPPRTGWTTNRTVDRYGTWAPMKLKGDDGGSILPRVIPESEYWEFDEFE